MNVEEAILDIIYMKEGNNELGIFFSNGLWEIHLGNSSGCVRLGEVDGDIVVQAETISQAIHLMEEELGL